MLETDIRPIKPNRNTPNQWHRDGAYAGCRVPQYAGTLRPQATKAAQNPDRRLDQPTKANGRNTSLRTQAAITESDGAVGACGGMSPVQGIPCSCGEDYRRGHDRPARNRAKVACGRLEAGRTGSESVCCKRGACGGSRRCFCSLGDHGACTLNDRTRTKRSRQAVATERQGAPRRWWSSAVDGTRRCLRT